MLNGCGDDDDNDAVDDDDDNDDDDNDDDDDDDDSGDDDDNDDDTPPIYGALLPGPGEEGYDPDLEAKARLYDRQHLIFNCAGNGINADATVAAANVEDRELIESFLQTTDEWDFEAWAGKPVFDVITAYHKVAGLYGGVGIAADAYRYGVLRDQAYDEAEVERAREFLKRDIEGLFIAVEITGTPGVIARGYQRTDIPGDTSYIELVPVFDEHGNPMPPEKTNGAWHPDNSVDGRFPNIIWEDSCSRDQFIGWASAFGALWEVIADDPTFEQESKDKLQQYASEIGRNLMVLHEAPPWQGLFDLEIIDADGRTTYHGYLNENAFDRIYLPFMPFKDGMYALMALGIVSALTYCAEDPVLDEYLYDHLIGERHLDTIAQNHQLGVNLGWQTNYSATNMAMAGALLAQRFIDDRDVRNKIRFATRTHLYLNGPLLLSRQPEEYAYSLFDFTYAAAIGGASVFNPFVDEPDRDAIARGVQTLFDFATPPYWNEALINCDEAELESGVCELNNGQVVTVLGEVGRKGTLICVEPIPQAVRPPSNYHWRSCPYTPNGEGDGSGLLPGVDFRWAYWYGRWVR